MAGVCGAGLARLSHNAPAPQAQAQQAAQQQALAQQQAYQMAFAQQFGQQAAAAGGQFKFPPVAGGGYQVAESPPPLARSARVTPRSVFIRLPPPQRRWSTSKCPWARWLLARCAFSRGHWVGSVVLHGWSQASWGLLLTRFFLKQMKKLRMPELKALLEAKSVNTVPTPARRIPRSPPNMSAHGVFASQDGLRKADLVEALVKVYRSEGKLLDVSVRSRAIFPAPSGTCLGEIPST